MRKISFTLIFILIFCVISFAQTDETSPCPNEVSINGPAGTTNPGEPQTYTATVKGGIKDKIKYVWSVDNGKIIKGQGTSVITAIQTDELARNNLTATVVIHTPSEDCGTVSASDVAPICECPSPSLFDEFPPFNSKLDKEKLTNFAVALQNDPTVQGYIIAKYKKESSENSLKTELMKISNFLVKERNIEADRITIIDGITEREEMIQLWIVPAGADEPSELKELRENKQLKQSSKTEETLPCPDGVTVTGPAGIIPNGQLTSFTAQIQGEVSDKIKYVWTVDNGTIVKGQGTSKIEVLKWENTDGGILRAIVEIEGLPEKCGKLSASDVEVIP